MPEKFFIDRPPRIEPELPSGVYNIPNPPDVEDNPGQVLSQAFLPMLMIFGYIMVSVMGEGRNMMMMVPMVMSVVGSVGLAVWTYLQEKKQKEAQEASYIRRISELRRKMESEKEQQRIYYFHNYPDPQKNLQMAADIHLAKEQRLEDLRSGTRLWERRSTDHDFMHLRLGLSTRQSTVTYKLSENEKTDNSLTLEARRLAEDSRLVFDVPVTIPMFFSYNEEEMRKVEQKTDDSSEGQEGETAEQKGKTVRHAFGISGTSKDKIYAYMRTLLVDFATHHSPQDAVLYVAGTNESRKHWRWAYPLPHCQGGKDTETLVFESEEQPGENEVDRMRNFWRTLRTILERRRMRILDREKGVDVRLPFILVVVDVQEAAPGWSALRDLEGEATVSTILLDGQMLGAGIVFLVPDRSKVPSRCSAIIEVDNAKFPEEAVFRYAETGFNTVRYVGTTKLVATQELVRDFSRNLEPLDIRRGYGSTLASTVTLLEMLNVSTLEELQAMARENWARSMDPGQADWLHTAVGLLSGNEPRTLKFSAKADGVHGVIAGSTGSGKSELLMTMIVGMALNFNPDVLNFVLIDYKGGSAFEPFKQLPHKVDIVTNLDESATARVFASIIAELDRRQKLNTYTNSKDIVHYRKKGLNLDSKSPPYPHLFIVIDEFAEMIAGNAEYKAQLESITRLGRALGVTLILAAQRPTGITDQMRANIKFRISLRVETPDDSREMLRRSDAAFLPPGIPGRGYLQVGNENIELIQTAYTGGDYKGPQEDTSSPNVIWLDREKKKVGAQVDPPKLYDVVVDMLGHLAEEESRPQWRPWPEFLPPQTIERMLSLTTPLDTAYMTDDDLDMLRGTGDTGSDILTLNARAGKVWDQDFDWNGINWGRNAMRPLIGLVDNPYQATQKPLTINFPAGHAVVFGASGRGKTTFLRTVITSLAMTHSPDELHVYVFDFGGRALTLLQDLPHVGAVITSEEEERVLRGLRKVNEIIDQRQVIFSEARVNSLDSYNLSHPDNPFPAVLVVLDNFAEFKEYYENLMGPMISLVREGRAYGVHFLFSADMPNSLSSKLFNLVTERFTLKLSDPTEYSAIVGRGVPADLSPVPGRGYVRVGNMPLEFQTALTFDVTESDPDGMADIAKMCSRMDEIWGEDRWHGKKPSTIETLQLRVSLDNLMKEAKLPESKRLNAIMGIDDRSLEPLIIDVERMGPHMVVVGQPFSGKTTTLRTMIFSLAMHYSPDDVMMVLIDYSRKLWKGEETSLAEIPHVVQTIDEIDQLDGMLESFEKECLDFDEHPKRRKIMIFIDNYDAFTDESSRKKMQWFERMSALVRKYQTAGVYLIISGSTSMMSATDDLRKVFTAPNFGIALKSEDAVTRLYGKFPRSLANTELPMGRGFTVRSGITKMLQIATPYVNDEDTEGSMDMWIRRILKKHSGPKVEWLYVPEPEDEEEGDGQSATVPGTSSSSKRDVKKYDLKKIKKLLAENGMPEELTGMMSDDDIIETAIGMDLIEDQDKAG